LREATSLGQGYDSGMSNARSVEELYTAHARLVRSVCRSVLRDREEAEDAVQQTFLSAQRALGNGSVPREPAAWLATIARNECLARVRQRMREPLPVDEEPIAVGADAHSAAVTRYEAATLREALADLPRAQREAILLRELRGLSYDEVARALSITTGAVESLIFRARRTLQVRLSEALSALSPAALFGRMFGGGDDLSGPVVAKVAAIGTGAAILAGGAALGPRAFVHNATKTHHSALPAHVRVVTPETGHVWSEPSHEPADTHEAERETTVSVNAPSNDIAAVSRPEPSSPEPETSSADTSSSDSETTGKTSSGTSTTPAVPPTHHEAGDSAEPGDATDSSDTGD
jgi:RNA polymerase sigma-70 factor (ECF subfamily)